MNSIMCSMRQTISYEPIDDEEIVFQPKNIKIDYMNWKMKYDEIIDELNVHSEEEGCYRHEIFDSICPRGSLRREFERIRKKLKIKTKKDIIEYYRKIEILKKGDNDKELMKKYKNTLILMYADRKYKYDSNRLHSRLRKYYKIYYNENKC